MTPYDDNPCAGMLVKLEIDILDVQRRKEIQKAYVYSVQLSKEGGVSMHM